MKTPKVYIIILVVMFSFLLLSPFRDLIIIFGVLFGAITLGRYLIFKREGEEFE